ncbi:MAG: hypothetical protein ACWGSQ_13795 [Longimicrobiales bacterium]
MVWKSAIPAVALVSCLWACAPRTSQAFDPEDPQVAAVIDSLMTVTVEAAARVDPVGVLAAMGGGDEFTLVTGNVMLTGLGTVQEAFVDTYDGLLEQRHTIYETRTRLLSPDVAVFSAVGEGVYTDEAGWTSDPVGIGLTVIFVREDGKWVGRYIHQSVQE